LRDRITSPDDPVAPLASAFDYMVIHRSDERFEQHGPFAPMLETATGQYPPPLRELPDETVSLWEKLSSLVTHPYLKARLHDLLWERRWSDRPDRHASSAIESYLELRDEASGLEYADALMRAAEIARSISDEERHHVVALAGLDRAEDELASPEPKPGIVMRLLDVAALDQSDDVANRCLRLLQQAGSVFADPWINEEIVDREVALCRDEGERGRELLRQSIERWRHEASSTSGTKRLFYLSHALERAHANRFPELAEEIRLEMQGLELEGEMQTVTAEVELPREHIERTIEWIAAGEDWSTCLRRLASLGPLSGSWARNLESVRQQANQFPLQHLFPSHVVGPWNQTLFIASSDEEKADLELSRYETVGISIASYTVADALDRIQTNLGRPLKTEVQAYCSTSIIDSNNAERIAAAVEHFAAGRFDECVMVILPRIEATIRELVRRTGAPIWWEPQPRRRFGRQRPLSQLLHQLKGSLDDDWRRYFITLLTNPLGPNLRNLYLHGLAPAANREHAAVLVHVAASLALIAPVAQAGADNEPS